MKKTLLLSALGLAAAAGPALAEIEGELSVAYVSEYNYRGAGDFVGFSNDNTDTVSTAIDLSYDLGNGYGIVAGASINSLTNSGFDHDSFHLGLTTQLGCFDTEIGYRWHEFTPTGFQPNQHTGEIYANLGMECPFTGADLNLLLVHDFDGVKGQYVELSGTKAFAVGSQTLELTAGISAGWDYWTNANGLNHGYITVGMPFALTETFTVTPSVSYVGAFSTLDGDTSDEWAPIVNQDDELIWGLRGSVSF